MLLEPASIHPTDSMLTWLLDPEVTKTWTHRGLGVYDWLPAVPLPQDPEFSSAMQGLLRLEKTMPN